MRTKSSRRILQPVSRMQFLGCWDVRCEQTYVSVQHGHHAHTNHDWPHKIILLTIPAATFSGFMTCWRGILQTKSRRTCSTSFHPTQNSARMTTWEGLHSVIVTAVVCELCHSQEGVKDRAEDLPTAVKPRELVAGISKSFSKET